MALGWRAAQNQCAKAVEKACGPQIYRRRKWSLTLTARLSLSAPIRERRRFDELDA